MAIRKLLSRAYGASKRGVSKIKNSRYISQNLTQQRGLTKRPRFDKYLLKSIIRDSKALGGVGLVAGGTGYLLGRNRKRR